MEYMKAKKYHGKWEIKGRRFDTYMIIHVPGEPLVDTRPRVLGGFAFSENKNIIVSLFKEYYKYDEVLQNTFIMGEYAMIVDGYFSISKKDLKTLQKEYPKDYKNFLMERLPYIGEKDCDNHVKLHNDLLIDKVFMIANNDNYNFHLQGTKWYTPNNPRTILQLYFNEKDQKNFIFWKTKQTKTYFDFLISDKYKNIMGYNDDEYRKHYFKTVKNKYEYCKTPKEKRDLIKSIMIDAENFTVDKLINLVRYKKVDKVQITKSTYLLLLRDMIIKECGIIKEEGK